VLERARPITRPGGRPCARLCSSTFSHHHFELSWWRARLGSCGSMIQSGWSKSSLRSPSRHPKARWTVKFSARRRLWPPDRHFLGVVLELSSRSRGSRRPIAVPADVDSSDNITVPTSGNSLLPVVSVSRSASTPSCRSIDPSPSTHRSLLKLLLLLPLSIILVHTLVLSRSLRTRPVPTLTTVLSITALTFCAMIRRVSLVSTRKYQHC
jgi:hypothetical protein